MLPSTFFKYEDEMGKESSVEMIVQDEDQIRRELEKARIGAEFIAAQRYSDADKIRFTKIIKEFNALYYNMNQQT